MTEPEPVPIIINFNQLADGNIINDIINWNGTNWEAIENTGWLSAGVNGQALVYDGADWVGSSTINGLSLTSTTNATLTIASNKTLTYNNSITIEGTDGTTITFPSSSSTLCDINSTQTLTNKTLTHPIITPESSTPTPTAGMMYFDTTENLLRFYNGSNWFYINMASPVSVYLPELAATSNEGIFYAVPVVTAIGLLDTPSGTTGTATNRWGSNKTLILSVSSAGNLITQVTNTQALNDYIEFSFDIQPIGIYSIIFTMGSRSTMGIIRLTEQTTGLNICQIDAYRGNTSTLLYQQEYPFIFTGSGGNPAELKIRWTVISKNTAIGSNYSLVLYNYIQLIRLA